MSTNGNGGRLSIAEEHARDENQGRLVPEVRTALDADPEVRAAIARVTGELVIDPVKAEQARYESAQLALQRAL